MSAFPYTGRHALFDEIVAYDEVMEYPITVRLNRIKTEPRSLSGGPNFWILNKMREGALKRRLPVLD